jgi:hypothetical protein
MMRWMSSFNIHQVAVDKKASSTRLGLSLMGIDAYRCAHPTRPDGSPLALSYARPRARIRLLPADAYGEMRRTSPVGAGHARDALAVPGFCGHGTRRPPASTESASAPDRRS